MCTDSENPTVKSRFSSCEIILSALFIASVIVCAGLIAIAWLSLQQSPEGKLQCYYFVFSLSNFIICLLDYNELENENLKQKTKVKFLKHRNINIFWICFPFTMVLLAFPGPLGGQRVWIIIRFAKRPSFESMVSRLTAYTGVCCFRSWINDLDFKEHLLGKLVQCLWTCSLEVIGLPVLLK